eukprot:374035-Pelagomonas_calceolata.AAC.8
MRPWAPSPVRPHPAGKPFPLRCTEHSSLPGEHTSATGFGQQRKYAGAVRAACFASSGRLLTAVGERAT